MARTTSIRANDRYMFSVEIRFMPLERPASSEKDAMTVTIRMMASCRPMLMGRPNI
ncbi:hypothetical protein D3C80_2018830 [compost metagenome]